jgi:rod shape-determining protein MreC
VNPKRFLLIPAILLFLYLGLFTWNQRTNLPDKISVEFGLELTGTILKPAVWLWDHVEYFYTRYVDLVGVREENEQLRGERETLRREAAEAAEERAELRRLRALLSLPDMDVWKPVGARVISGRIGPNAALESIIINRGYLSGGAVGTPVATNTGIVGRVLRASADTATVLLLTDPGSRIAVLSQDTRTPGILVGRGTRLTPEMLYAAPNTVRPGEILVTSGLDRAYPKGIPAARVVSVETDSSRFQNVPAEPLIDVKRLEEVLLLERPPADAGVAAPVLQSGPNPPSLPQGKNPVTNRSRN